MGAGFRTFASGEVLTAANVQDYLMDQAVMVFAGTAARGSALPSPETGMTAYSTATGLQVYNGTSWVDVSTGYGVATGGASTAITVGGVNYTLLTFTGDSTLTVTKPGLFDVLCIGGGGGGGLFSTGGGGGGWQSATFYCSANVSIVVGAGGAVNSNSVVGGTSRFGDFLSCGGGGSCDGALDTSVCGASNGGVRIGGVASRNFTVGQGTGGTTGRGGSGAGGVQSGDTGGAGKEVNTFIGGSSLLLAKGGDSGGGAGSANTGDGGGAAGGSGVVYVRFKV